MSNTASNVTAGKPNTTGAVYYAAKGTTLPTNETDALTGWTSVGYISEDGVTNAMEIESEDIKAWGGDTVLSVRTGKTDTFTFRMLESMNPDVLKVVHGASNVTGTLATGVTVNVNATQPDNLSWVIDQIMTGGVKKRIVIPDAAVSSVSEVQYTDNAAVGYEVTLTCLRDASGQSHYEYNGPKP